MKLLLVMVVLVYLLNQSRQWKFEKKLDSNHLDNSSNQCCINWKPSPCVSLGRVLLVTRIVELIGDEEERYMRTLVRNASDSSY